MTKSLFCGSLMLLVLTGCYKSTTKNPETPDKQVISVNELMISVITPATNILWAVEDPQTEEDWKQLEDAALTTIAAGMLVKQGGAASMDNVWANEPAWREFADQMINAAVESRNAARNRDLSALLAAGDMLYPPCVDCHNQFHTIATD